MMVIESKVIICSALILLPPVKSSFFPIPLSSSRKTYSSNTSSSKPSSSFSSLMILVASSLIEYLVSRIISFMSFSLITFLLSNNPRPVIIHPLTLSGLKHPRTGPKTQLASISTSIVFMIEESDSDLGTSILVSLAANTLQ